MIIALSIVGLVLSAIPASLFFANLPLFQEAEPVDDETSAAISVSVLIPARDEASSISASVHAALSSENVHVEVVVLDDHSTDSTAEIVNAIATSDDRVRCVSGRELPDGWNGKQHACWQLASAATHETLVFLDADVRLQPDALSTLLRRKRRTGVALLSAFPHQETGTWLEKLIIPMMHYILLCYLPFRRMRDSADPAFASGCGQLFLTSRDDYKTAGSHAAIRESRHDGIKLPRAYRSVGLSTDVIDGTDLATCRMYTSAAAVVRGVLKNAVEGIANPRLIVVFTVLLLGGSVLPLLTLAWATIADQPIAAATAFVGLLLGHSPRALAAVRFRQSWLGVIFHSAATTIFFALQWFALAMAMAGKQVAWRGRKQS